MGPTTISVRIYIMGADSAALVSSFVKRIQPGLGCERALFALKTRGNPAGPSQPRWAGAQPGQGPRWAGLLPRSLGNRVPGSGRRLSCQGNRGGALSGAVVRGAAVMAEAIWSSDTGEAVYRSRDPVRNLRLR